MPIKLFCLNCDSEIPEGEDYIDLLMEIKEWDGESTRVDSKDSEDAIFCEDCAENKSISILLLNKINKRNPNPDRKK